MHFPVIPVNTGLSVFEVYCSSLGRDDDRISPCNCGDTQLAAMEDPALESIQTAENIGSDDTIDDKSLEADPPKAEHGHEDEPLCRICFSGADEEDLGVPDLPSLLFYT